MQALGSPTSMQALGSPTSSIRMDTSCGALLRELQHIWYEMGESEAEKDRMLLELERECLEVYRRKVDEASNAKARLHQSVAAREAELAALMAALGELSLHSQPLKRCCKCFLLSFFGLFGGSGMTGHFNNMPRPYYYYLDMYGDYWTLGHFASGFSRTGFWEYNA